MLHSDGFNELDCSRIVIWSEACWEVEASDYAAQIGNPQYESIIVNVVCDTLEYK